MQRRPTATPFNRTIFVGAITILCTVIGVYLAYNAHKGLPFVPTHLVRVQLPNGGKFQEGNDIREAGFRIGLVERVRPVRLPDGTAGAEATIKLDDAAWPLPRDTTVAIRGQGVLGRKYLEVRRGAAEQPLDEGGLIAATDAALSEDLDRFFGIFDEATRDGARSSLKGYGTALASRGTDLNRALEIAPSFVRNADVALTVLSARETRIGRFVTELGDVARAIRPVADRYAHSFGVGADTFAALARDPEALDRTIRDAAPTLRIATPALRNQRPLLRELARLGGSLERVAARLPATLPPLTRLATTGARVLPAGTQVTKDTRPVLAQLRTLSLDPQTSQALRVARNTTNTLNPLLRFVGPYVTVCNYFNYAFTHVADAGSEPDLTGTAARFTAHVPGRQDNSMGSLGASEPANSENVQTGVGGFLHQNVYSAAIDRQGNADCESGQRGFVERANVYGDPRFKTAVDPHIPGNQGPTFSGKPRVPAGQTFTRAPQLGPSMPSELDP